MSYNWITNISKAPVTVACHEMRGPFAPFTFDLRPGEKNRLVPFNAEANVYPAGQYSYDDLEYKLGSGEKWEVRKVLGVLMMHKLGPVERYFRGGWGY